MTSQNSQSFSELNDSGGNCTVTVAKQKLDENTLEEPKTKIYLESSSDSEAGKKVNDISSAEEPVTQKKSQQQQNHINKDKIQSNANRQEPDRDTRQKGRISLSQQQNVKLERAVRFLQHPSVLPLLSTEKELYLRSKGLSDDEIEKAKALVHERTEDALFSSSDIDSVWRYGTSSDNIEGGTLAPRTMDKIRRIEQSQKQAASEQEKHNLGYRYPPNYFNHTKSENPELPNPFVPLTLGGLITLVGLASLRWLNGGDFILFPPSTAYTSQSDEKSLQSGLEEESREPESENTRVPLFEKEDQVRGCNETSSVDDGSLDDQTKEDWNEGYQDDCGIGNLQQSDKSGMFQQSLLGSNVAIELCKLTKAVEAHSSVHERILQLSLNEKAKNVTNSAMNILRYQGTSCSGAQEEAPVVKAMNPSVGIIHDNNESDRSFDLTVLVQITEIKCTLNSIKDNIQRTKSNEEENTQSKKIQDTRDKGDTDASESCDSLCDILNKLQEVSDTLSRIESKIYHTGSPLLEKSLDDKKKEVVENTRQVISDVDAHGITLRQQQTKSVDNKDAACLIHPRADCNEGSLDLLNALNHLTKENTSEQVQSCAQMLYMYTMNLSSNPNLPRYRKVYTNNNAFKQKVDTVEGARNILTVLGFVDLGSYLEWKGDDSEIETMADSSIALLKEAVEALSLLKTGKKLNVGTTGIKAKQKNGTVKSNDEYVGINKNTEDFNEKDQDGQTS